MTPLERVLARLPDARREGAGFKARCPAHNDGDPSLSVTEADDGRVLIHCFAGCPPERIAEALGLTMAGLYPTAVTLGHARARKRRGATTAQRDVAQLLEETVADPGRIASYLRFRGLSNQVPSVLRFHPALPCFHEKRCVGKFPAMIAPVVSAAGKVTGVHRTYLDSAGPGKARVPEPKKTLGTLKGGAIRLAAVTGDVLALAEGIETALAVTEATGTPCWSASGTVNMAEIDVPEAVRVVEIWADWDEPGRKAAENAARTHHAACRTVFVIIPERGDWLDVLCEHGSEALRQARSESQPWAPSGEEEAARAPARTEHLTDLGNTRRLVAAHGNDLRFCAKLG